MEEKIEGKGHVMKVRFLIVVTMLVSLLCLNYAYAANGNLIVNGNLGVGVHNPQDKAEINGNLTVNGNVKVGSKITFPDNTTQMTAASANELVWDYKVMGSPAKRVTSPPLNGNVDTVYDFEFWLFVPPHKVWYRLYYNGDVLDENYGFDYYYQGTVAGNAGALEATFLYWGDSQGPTCRVTGTIGMSPNGYIITNYHGFCWPNTNNNQYIFFGSHKYKNPVSGITQLDVDSTLEGDLGVNSRFRVWKRK